MRQKLPKLEFTGQTTDELLACKDTHNELSIVYAFQWGIQAKERRVGEDGLSEEERTVLAVLALQREVFNGGYFQFFWNSSRSYAPFILKALDRIGQQDAAEITSLAIAALGIAEVTVESVSKAILNEDPVRDAVFSSCDNQYYKLVHIFPALLRFIIENAGNIQLERTDDYPRFPKRKESSKAAKLELSLRFWKKEWRPTLEEAREVAAQIARQKQMETTESDLENAALFFLFGRAMREEDLNACDELAVRVFEQMAGEIMHSVIRREWVKLLLKHGRDSDADAWTLSYLKHIGASEPPDGLSQKNLEFWGAVLQDNRDTLPNAVAYFEPNYPQVDLSKPVPRTIIYKTKRVPGTGPLSDQATGADH